MEAALAVFLASFIPYLVKKGEGLAEKAVDTFGAAAWDRAKAIWGKLRPKVDADQGAQKVVEAIASDPEDEEAQAALKFQLRAILEADPELREQLAGMLREAQEAGVVNQAGNVIDAGGNVVLADRSAVAAGRDIIVRGGIHTGSGGSGKT